MGIDFNKLFSVGQGIAARGGDLNRIDPGEEASAFDIEVQKEAARAGVDASEIYSNTSISKLMGVEIGKKEAGDELADALSAYITPDTEASVQQTLNSLEIAFNAGIDIDEIEDEFGIGVADEVLTAYGNGKAKRYENTGDQYGMLVDAGYSEKETEAFMLAIMA